MCSEKFSDHDSPVKIFFQPNLQQRKICIYVYVQSFWVQSATLKVSLNEWEINYHTKQTTNMPDLFERHCCVWGYCMYKEVHIWEASVGKLLICEWGPDNTSNKYAVELKKKKLLLGTCLANLQEFICCSFNKGNTCTLCTVTAWASLHYCKIFHQFNSPCKDILQ